MCDNEGNSVLLLFRFVDECVFSVYRSCFGLGFSDDFLGIASMFEMFCHLFCLGVKFGV